MTKGKTYWSVAAEVDGCVKCTSRKPTLNEAITEGFASSLYYHSVYPAAVHTTTVAEKCDGCHNEGVVQRPRFKTVRCPECRGKVPTESHTFVVRLPFNGVMTIQEPASTGVS